MLSKSSILYLSIVKYFVFLLLLFTWGCRSYHSVSALSGNLVVSDSTVAIDSSLVIILEPYKSVINIEMNEIIGYSETAIIKNLPEGPLGNFVCDALLYMCNKYYSENEEKFDVSLFNNGGLREALPKGVITVGDVYRTLPFENKVVIITLTGEVFLKLVNYIIKSGGVPFSGMRIVANQLNLETLTIGASPFDAENVYRVITSDFLVYSDREKEFFSNYIDIKELDVKIRDIIIDYLREQTRDGNNIHPKIDGRLLYE